MAKQSVFHFGSFLFIQFAVVRLGIEHWHPSNGHIAHLLMRKIDSTCDDNASFLFVSFSYYHLFKRYSVCVCSVCDSLSISLYLLEYSVRNSFCRYTFFFFGFFIPLIWLEYCTNFALVCCFSYFCGMMAHSTRDK